LEEKPHKWSDSDFQRVMAEGRRALETSQAVLKSMGAKPTKVVQRPISKAPRPIVPLRGGPIRAFKPENQRKAFVQPILDNKGWSIGDWAQESKVDFHTAQNYLDNKRKAYKSTVEKLAKSLGVDVSLMPN
jgi:hypothetical protein